MALTVSHPVADRPTDRSTNRPPPALLRRNIGSKRARARARSHLYLYAFVTFFFPRRVSTTILPANLGAALKNEPGHYFCSPSPRLLYGLTGPVPPFLSFSSSPSLSPPSRPIVSAGAARDMPHQRMCKNEKRETESAEGGR